MTIDPAPDTAPETGAYAAIETAAAPSFSADGRTLFHLRGTGLQQVWAWDLASGAARALTAHDERVAMLRRAPDDDRLIYGFDAGGDERQQFWLLNTTAQALTDDPGVICGFGAWHKDGARFSLTANDRDPAHYDILVQTIATGERARLHHGRHEMQVGPWHKDGARLIAWENRATGDQRPFVLHMDGTMEVVPRRRCANYAALRWDGDALLGLTDMLGDFDALCRIDPSSGDTTPVFQPPGRDVEAWSLSPDGRLLATIENDRGYGVLRVGPLAGERPVVAGFEQGVAADLAFSPDSSSLAFAWSAPERPSGLYLWKAGEVRAVWAPEPTLPTRPFELVHWPTFDGLAVPGWFATPAQPAPAAGDKAVIWVHGGPASQARANFRPDMQALLAAGYAVLMPNVRGSTGYGRGYMEADDREKRLDSVRDLVAARHYLAGRAGIDGQRIAVMGQSYGGYMVNAAVTENPELWRAAVNFYGIADFVTLLEHTGPWRRDHRAREYGNLVQHRALFDRISPIRHIDRARAPMLLLHGRRDPRVPFEESEQIEEALRLRQRRVRFETFDYAGHGFVRPDDKRRAYEAVVAWFDEHL